MSASKSLWMLLAALLTMPARAQQGYKPDLATLCRKNYKTNEAIARSGWPWIKNPALRAQLNDEMAVSVACSAVFTRKPDPCKDVPVILRADQGPTHDEKLIRELPMRCRYAWRFSGFYEEALKARPGQKNFPACKAFFAKQSGFYSREDALDVACPLFSNFIRTKTDGFCTDKLRPYVADQQAFVTHCKILGPLLLRGDQGVCAMEADHEICRSEAALSGAYQTRSPGYCPQGLEGGICRGILARAASSPKLCQESFQRLQLDFCTQLGQ